MITLQATTKDDEHVMPTVQLDIGKFVILDGNSFMLNSIHVSGSRVMLEFKKGI